uniref:TATA-box-binding protein-like n=1 Tax=Gasterosteus aculeatus aculeatus TaxID=481459 RepID=UPI001A98D55B|nr:TATA-box-binding protein-like [Gasterosteus aculeatus aculeatus]
MEDSVLERYFQKNSSRAEPEEAFMDLLPDELLTLCKDNSQNVSAEFPAQPETPVTPVTFVTPETRDRQQPDIVFQIHNVVSTIKLGCSLDLLHIGRRARNTEYRPKVFQALTMRIRKPPTTAQFYKSGSMVCLGAKSEEQSRVAAWRFFRIMQKLGLPVRFLDFKIQNIVASCETFPVRLEQLARYQPCSYQPELFKGLHLRVVPSATVTMFSSGKMVVSGAKSLDAVRRALGTMCSIVRRFGR